MHRLRVVFFLLAFVLVGTGCATNITVVEKEMECEEVGEFHGSFMWLPGTYGSFLGPVVGEADSKRQAKLKAEEAGATHIKWTRVSVRSGGAYATGVGYKCGKTTADTSRNRKQAIEFLLQDDDLDPND